MSWLMYLFASPAEDDFDHEAYSDRELPAGQTLAKKFPHLEYAAVPQVKDPGNWTLELTGEVSPSVLMTMPQIMEYGQSHRQDFHCITGWSILDTEWQGVPGEVFVRIADPLPTVTTVLVHGLDEFSTCLWLEDFMQGWVVYGYRGRPLSPEHGFPLRFIAPPYLWQYKACKWVTRLEFLTEHKLGFWEKRAYSDSALVWEDDRYANPAAAKGKSLGQLRLEALRNGQEKAE